MTRRTLLAAAALVPALLLVPAATASAAPAEPPTIGGLTIMPAKGSSTSSITLTTSSACPRGTNVLGKIHGKGFPSVGQNVVPNSAVTIYPRAGEGFTVSLQDTVDAFLELQPGRADLAGTYRLTLECRNPFGAPLGQFLGTLTFTSPIAYVAQAPKSYPAPAPGVGAQGGGSQGGGSQGAAGGGTSGAAGAQPGTGGSSAGASRFPPAPAGSAGPATTAVSDRLSGDGGSGLPLPLVVVALVVVVGAAVLATGRASGGRGVKPNTPRTATATNNRRVRIDTTATSLVPASEGTAVADRGSRDGARPSPVPSGDGSGR